MTLPRRPIAFALTVLLLTTSRWRASHAAEAWADPALPVQGGLALWLDATRLAAAAEADGNPLHDGDAVETWYDGSGHRRHLSQPHADARPSLAKAAVRFDGKQDHLLRDDPDASPLDAFTAVIVVTPRTNAGAFRGFLAASDLGKNDYRTGFNLDMGPGESDPTTGFDDFNVEGVGFRAALNLFDQTAVPLGQPHALVVTVGPRGADAVRAYLHGQHTGKRARNEARPISTQRLVLAARTYSNDATPPTPRGFLDGDVHEVLLYDRVLSDAERTSLHAYLVKKYPSLGESALSMRESARAGTAPLVAVKDPPAVQMFVPGFSARPLPVDLQNINNLRYREDGKLVAMAYDGNVFLLTDTDGDGLEDKADLFWDNGKSGGSITQPIGIALTPPSYPHGRGLFVAGKNKLSLVVDTDGDDRADKEIIAATGWPGSFVNVDALGVAIDPKDGSIYFGLGTPNFAEPYLKDERGVSQFKLAGERGTILRVAPDFKSREVVCTGIRFPVGLAFNAAGDLFATDQEGATWSPNGNPFDELLHIQRGRHYGFPARHPVHLPSVIDEPSTFDYGPQHQSTCGLTFNEPVNGGPSFGPPAWRGDAIVCGESRGKLYRTSLVKTPAGYVARNQLIASIPLLLIDATVSPRGDLALCAHSGAPDWGSGPSGRGKLFQIRYLDGEPSRGLGVPPERSSSQPLARDAQATKEENHAPSPQPTLVWPAGPGEVRVAFDQPLDPATLAGISGTTSIVAGRYVAAGDRFEVMRPGYAVVKRQTRAPRDRVEVGSVQLARDGRTLVIGTSPQRRAVGYGITLPGPKRTFEPGEIAQHATVELAYDLTGVAATWTSADGATTWSGWLPHADLAAARAFTAGSAEHDALWKHVQTPGTLRLTTALDLRNMIQPAVQPGSQIDFTPAPERVRLTFGSNAKMSIKDAAPDNTITVTPTPDQFMPLELTLTTGSGEPSLTVSFTTQEDDRPRPLALKRFHVPWARPDTDKADATDVREPIPQIAGGDWLRGRAVFFGNEAGCAKCHQVRGQGSDLGPDLSNLIHRDYDSVLRDIREPSGALNPDYIATSIAMRDGRVFHGLMRGAGDGSSDTFVVRGDYDGERATLKRADVRKITPSALSIMPTGLPEGLGEAKMRDLLTFLLTEPLSPAPIERKGAPPPRSRAEVDAVLKSARHTTNPSAKPLTILLVAGPKDHGPSEHDYPAWQKRWATLLGLADAVTVEQADGWPSFEQWERANVAVFYSANPAWDADRAKDIDAHLARGRGLVYLHYAVDGRKHVEPLADRIGLAWRGGASKFRHGPLTLTFRDTDHPITRGFTSVSFVDESYWNLVGDPNRIHLLADAPEEGSPQPLLWTRDQGGGKVFVSILGHYSWTFDDPLFRVLVLRGICWTAGDDADRLSGLATIGARIGP